MSSLVTTQQAYGRLVARCRLFLQLAQFRLIRHGLVIVHGKLENLL